ncbi:MAG: outer membrane lipoprotein carrier protein LolA [Parvularculaceae bacterium]
MSFSVLAAMTLFCADGAYLPAIAAPSIAVAAVQDAAAAAPQAAPKETAGETLTDEIPAEDLEARDGAYDGPLVFENETDAAVADKLIAYIESIDTLEGEFTQIAPSGVISAGKFYLRRPGQLRFDYEPPTPLLIVASGGLVYVRDDALETTDSYPVGKTPLKFLLRKKVDRDDAKLVQVDRGVDSIAVTFASNDEDTEGELILIASAPDFALRRWIVRDLNGGMTVVTLENVKSGVKLANSLFAAPEAGGRFLDR